MKKCRKLLALTLSVLLVFACYAVPAFASSSANQNGLEATIVTDKESYKANEEIHVTVTVKNTNDFKVEAVSIESLLPETLTLKDGDNSTKTVDLEPGETLTLSFTAVKEKEETSATEPESQNTEPTETEPVIPSESQTVKPSESESVKPSETETAKPSESETVKPSEAETQKPTQAPTTEQPTQGTTTPITTKPTVPATTGGTTLAPGTTGTQSTTGGIIGDLATTFPKITTPADSATTAQGENPDTGDSMSMKTLAIAIIALLAVIAVVIILMYKYKKQTTKIISLVMCVAIAATAITGVSFFTAKGADDERKSFTVEKVITVDGEETKVNADVKYQGIEVLSSLELSSNPRELRTNDKPQEVCFYAETNVKVDYIILFNAKTDEEVAKLLDNGLLESNGDNVENDGTYSGKVMIPCEEKQMLEFYAVIESKGEEIRSEKYELEVIAAPDKQQIEQMNQVDDKIGSIIESKNFQNLADNKKKETILKEFSDLKVKGLVQEFEFDDEEQMVLFNYSNGLPGFWHIKENDSSLAGRSIEFNQLSNVKKNIEETQQRTTTSDGTGKALIIYGWDNPFKDDSQWALYESIKAEWTNLGLKTVLDAQPTVADLKSLLTEQIYNYIVIAEHGSKYKGKYFIGTQEKCSSENDENAYWHDLNSDKKRVIRGDSEYYLAPEFFSFYYKDKLNNSIIDIESCMGYGSGNKEDYSFSNAFINTCKAKNVLGYHNSVWIEYSAFMSYHIVTDLLAKGYNISKAFEEAKKELGSTDKEYRDKYHPDWKNNKKEAYPILKGASNTKLQSVYTKGKGTINDPYQISTAQQLNAVRYNLKSNFVLVNDIDLSEYKNWVPIGGMLDVEAGDGFQGTFDGKGHTIKNLKMDYTLLTPEDSNTHQYTYGLFANTQNSPNIKNINLEDVDVTIKVGGTNYFSSIYVGSVSALSSEIENCTTKGNIKVLDVNETKHFINVGGICAQVNTIANCTNEIDFQINGTTGTYSSSVSPYIGGIVARSESKIIDCANKGDITCIEGFFYSIASGGISAVGSSNGSIVNSQNYGMIDISAYSIPISVGGIIGILSSSNIDTCINYGIISARAYGGVVEAGGILGGTSTGSQGSINKSVNYGNISAIATDRPMTSSFAGGISGTVQRDITMSNCYNACNSIVSKTRRDDGSVIIPVIARIGDHSNYATVSFVNNYSIESTTLNGSIPTEDIGPDQKNGGSMTKAEIEKAIQELGFELPGELPNAS